MSEFDFMVQAAEAKKAAQIPDGPAFAVVLANKHNKQFTKWHATLEEAKQEAERLAGVNNQPFAIVQFVGVMEPAQRPVTWKPAA
jgi:hypothetical protein